MGSCFIFQWLFQESTERSLYPSVRTGIKLMPVYQTYLILGGAAYIVSIELFEEVLIEKDGG